MDRTDSNRRAYALFDLLVVVFAVVFPHVAMLPMLVYPLVVLSVIWLWLKMRHEKFSDINFRWRDLKIRVALIGLVFGIVWAALVVGVIGPVLVNWLHLPAADLKDFYFIRESWPAYIQLLLIACLWVIPYEEIVFRGLVLTVAGRYMPFRLAGLLTSVLFAAYHWQEGISAVITIFFGALISVWLMRRWNYNIWIVIFFHIAYDIVLLTLLKYGIVN